MCCRSRKIAVVLALAGVTSSMSAAAATPSPRWALRGHIVASDYADSTRTTSISGTTYLELSGGSGLELAAERRMRERLGWEISVGQISLDTSSSVGHTVPVSFDPLVLREEITPTGSGTLTVRPLAVALLFHPWAARRFDLYLGPTAGLALFDVGRDLDERDSELLYGAKLGAELKIRESAWSVGLELRHIEIAHETADRDLNRDIRLTTAAIGMTYHLGGQH